jgi:hypothetical protein
MMYRIKNEKDIKMSRLVFPLRSLKSLKIIPCPSKMRYLSLFSNRYECRMTSGIVNWTCSNISRELDEIRGVLEVSWDGPRKSRDWNWEGLSMVEVDRGRSRSVEVVRSWSIMFKAVRTAHKTICDCRLMLEGDMKCMRGHSLTFKVRASAVTLFELDWDRSRPFEMRSNAFEVDGTVAQTCYEQMRKVSEYFQSSMCEVVLSADSTCSPCPSSPTFKQWASPTYDYLNDYLKMLMQRLP